MPGLSSAEKLARRFRNHPTLVFRIVHLDRAGLPLTLAIGNRRCAIGTAAHHFIQRLLPLVARSWHQAAGSADLLLAIGSTLAVYPVACAVPLAKETGARVVIINAGATEMEGIGKSNALFRVLPVWARQSASAENTFVVDPDPSRSEDLAKARSSWRSFAGER